MLVHFKEEGPKTHQNTRNSVMLQSATQVKELELYKQSVIKVYADAADYSYAYPWQGATTCSWNGSGFIVNYDGNPYIITNAHVAANADQLDVRLSEGDKKYAARVVNVDHHCDLAMLAVDDPSFWEKVRPLELGDMPELQDKLKVVGYPMGGKELCITKGIVSRNEVGKYCHSGVEFLHTQVSAEINPGNSGGPAIYENKVLGVAFQGIMFGDGLGYIIPAPVLKHFIEDTLSPGPYKGFPHLAFSYQTMENAYMREEYGMTTEESGIRIKGVDKLSSAKDLLKPDDIILAIDGHKVHNDGTVSTSVSNRIKYIQLIREKSIGENVTFSILREGERLDVDVPLKHRCNQTKQAQQEWDKPPTYYINSGIVFAPVTAEESRHKKLTEKAKKRPGQEKIMIQTILPSEHTRGLDKSMQRGIIKRVNGKKVNNLRDVIDALESHDGPRHKIITKGEAVFVFNRLSEAQTKAILRAKRISCDRSEDLLDAPVYASSSPEFYAFTPGYGSSSSRVSAHAASSSGTTPSSDRRADDSEAMRVRPQ